MSRQRRGERVLLLVLVGLAMAAFAILYLTAPPPTVFVVRVVDAETGAPLPGAQVKAHPRNGLSLPALLTDDAGIARFQDAPPDPAYSIRVQKVDYDLGSKENLAVPKEQETEVVVSLAPHAGERLFVGLDKGRIAEIDISSWLTAQTIDLPVAPEAQVYHLLLHPTEDLLYAVAGDKGLILDSHGGATLGRMQVGTGIDTLDLSAGGEYLLVTTVRGGLSESGTLGLIHLLALDVQSGEVVTDSLLLEHTGWTADAVLIGGANDLSVSTGGGTAGAASRQSMPLLLWRPEGSYAYVLEATEPAVRELNVAARSMLDVYLAPAGPVRADAIVVLSHDKQYAFTWHQAVLPSDEAEVDLLTLIWTDDGTVMSETYPRGTSALAASPVKDEVYILNGDLGTLTILDMTGQAAQTVVAVGKNPESIAIKGDGQTAFVGNRGSQTISVIDLALGSVVFTVPLPGEPLSLAVR